MGVEPTYAAWEAVIDGEISVNISVFDLYLTCTCFDGLSGEERGALDFSVSAGVEIGVDFCRGS